MEIKVGNMFTGEIIDFTHEGKGVIKLDDFIVFVSGGLVGDKVDFTIDKMKKNFATGSVVKIIESSKDRIELDFEIEESTGGIPLIEYKYSKQLEWKREKVKRDLEKIGGISNIDVKETIGMEYPFRYRNHVQIPVATKDGKTVIGFYELNTNDIVDMRETILQSEVGNKVLDVIRNWIDKYNIKAYDRKTKKGLLRHIGIRTNKDNEAMVILVTGSEKLYKQRELIELLTSNIEEVKSIYHNVNRMNSSVIYGKHYNHIYGEEKLIDSIGDYKFYISPNSFFQVNRTQAEVLYNKAIEYLNVDKNDIIYDLYCGIGTISIYGADKVRHVYGVEVVKEAIEDAKENKRLNNVENIDFIVGKSEEELSKLVKSGVKANKVILDPPRKGCEKEVLETLIQIKPEKIVYVSCNPTTMSRDAKYLVENGYKVEEVQPVDMFPHTGHTEVVCKLERQ